MQRVALLPIAGLLLTANALGQRALYEALPGPRHVVVLVDSSRSMVADVHGGQARSAKRRALAEAERALVSALTRGTGPLDALPELRPGRDLLTVVHFGIDSRPDSSQAYRRLASATLGSDYARPVMRAQTRVTARALHQALRPQIRTNLNVLAWAFPLGLRSTAAGTDRPVQQTYVVLLNDSQLNDGSIALEKHTLERWLGAAGQRSLSDAETLLAKTVRLTNRQGAALPLSRTTFGRGLAEIALTSYVATSVAAERRASEISGLHPLEGASLEWLRKSGRAVLEARFQAPKELRGRRAVLTVANLKDAPKAELTLGLLNRAELAFKEPPERSHAKLVLKPVFVHEDPILGSFSYAVPFEEPVLMPASPEAASAKRARTAALAMLVLGLVGLLVWAFRHGWLASHFRLRLPGYARSFDLPPVSQMRRLRYGVRVPSWNEDALAWLVLPPNGIRRLFYRRATLSWDPAIRVVGLSEDATEADLIQLPRVVPFAWRDRPALATDAKVHLTRRLGPLTHTMEIVVRFAALPGRAPRALSPAIERAVIELPPAYAQQPS